MTLLDDATTAARPRAGTPTSTGVAPGRTGVAAVALGAPGTAAARWWRRLRAHRAAVVVTVLMAVTAAQLVTGSGQPAGAATGDVGGQPAHTANPERPGRVILSGPDSTDPFMVKVAGRYYLYTSQQYYLNVPLRTGTTIGRWGKPVDALPHLPNWAESGFTWAPDVHQVAGGWALYFTALLKGAAQYTHCIGSAFGKSPSGPFVPTSRPIICQLDHRGSIDARVFVEPGGRLVMLWKSEDNANPNVPGPDQNGPTGIYAQYLSANGRNLLGHAVKIMGPTEAWEGTIVEAPDMVQARGIYWLFFSGNWFNSSAYGIGVAACRSPLGPCFDPDPGPFLGSNAQGAGPGEQSLFRTGSAIYLLYNPFKSNSPGPIIARPVDMTRIGFSSKGPYLAAS
ncbi:MAG: glycoside hydrolase family 43 protein [Acidimicrobiales bacterium]